MNESKRYIQNEVMSSEQLIMQSSSKGKQYTKQEE